MNEQDEHKVTTLDELYDYIKRFSLSDALLIISISNNAFKYGFHMISEDTNPNAAAWISDVGKTYMERASVMMQLTRFARFILLSRSNDYRSAILDTGTPQMNQSLFLVSTLHEKELDGEIKNDRDLNRIMGRISQWQFPLQIDRGAVIGRGYLLFMEIPQTLKLKYDFDQKMQGYFGLGVMQFIASGIAAWVMSNGVLKYKLTIQIPALQNVVTTSTLDKFVELSSGTPWDYRKYIRGGDGKEINKLVEIYGLDPFLSMPAIRVGRSRKLEPDQYVVPQPLYLLQRASLGTFYLLGDKEQSIAQAAGKPGQNPFREAFGEVYRNYVGKQLRLAHWPTRVIDLDEEINTNLKRPDFALIKGNICILFEVKTGFLTVNSRMLFNEEAAKREIANATSNFKKAMDQLNLFEDAINNGNVKHPLLRKNMRKVKVILGFEDVYMANGFLLPLAREIYGEQVDRLQFATLSDVEAIGTRLARWKPVVKFMWDKVTLPGFAEWPVSGYLNHRSPKFKAINPILRKAFEEFISQVSGQDYRNGNDPFLNQNRRKKRGWLHKLFS